MFSTFSTRYCIFFEVSSKSVNLDARLSPVYWRCNFSIGINISSSFKKSPLTKPDKNSPLYSICTGLYPTKGIPRVLFISTFLFLFHSQDPLMISCHISIRFFNNQQRIIKRYSQFPQTLFVMVTGSRKTSIFQKLLKISPTGILHNTKCS